MHQGAEGILLAHAELSRAVAQRIAHHSVVLAVKPLMHQATPVVRSAMTDMDRRHHHDVGQTAPV